MEHHPVAESFAFRLHLAVDVFEDPPEQHRADQVAMLEQQLTPLVRPKVLPEALIRPVAHVVAEARSLCPRRPRRSCRCVVPSPLFLSQPVIVVCTGLASSPCRWPSLVCASPSSPSTLVVSCALSCCTFSVPSMRLLPSSHSARVAAPAKRCLMQTAKMIDVWFSPKGPKLPPNSVCAEKGQRWEFRATTNKSVHVM